MNKLLRAILVVHPFMPYALFSLEPSVIRVLALTGIVAILLVHLCSLGQQRNSIAIPYIWAYILVQSILLGLPIYCAHVSLFFLLYSSVASVSIDWQYVLKPLGYVCMAMSLLSILQGFGIGHFSYTWVDNPGLLGNATNSAMYIAVTSPFILMHKRGWLYFIIPCIAVFMLNSASAILGILSILIGYYVIKKYFVSMLIFISGVLLQFLFWKQKVIELFNPHEKLIIWSQAMNDWRNFAWFGSGLGNFDRKYIIDNIYYNMNNHYLYILYCLGIVGFVLFLIWLIPHLKRDTFAVEIPYLSFVAVLVMSLCSIPMRVYPLTILTAVNMAILHRRE